jgi:hypothetical protein
MNVLSEIDGFTETENDQVIFDRAINFLLALDVDKLHTEQLDNLAKIITQIESSADNIQEVKHARKSLATVKTYARSYWRKNRIRLKARKKKIARSAEGRKRLRNKDRNSKVGKTPGGRRKILYNTIGHVNV